MIKKLLFLGILVGITALCPAPIIDKSAHPHTLPIKSAADMAAGQRFNGTQKVVGYVPQFADENGTIVPKIKNDHKGATNVAMVSPAIQARAVRNLTVAQHELKLDHSSGGSSSFVTLLGVILVVVGGLFGAKTYLEKYGPAPKTFNPSERLRKVQ